MSRMDETLNLKIECWCWCSVVGLGFLTESVLVIVHPDLEDVALDAGVAAELLNHRLVLLLNSPPQCFSQPQHSILLLLREFRPESLLPAAIRVRHVLLLLPPARRRRQSQRPVLWRHVEVPSWTPVELRVRVRVR